MKRYSDDPELLFRAGVLTQHAGRNADAERYYRTVLDGQFTPKFRSIDRVILGYKTGQNLACLYDEQGRHTEAEPLWRQIVDERPRYHVGWRGLVTNLLRQGKLSEARELVDGSDLLCQSPGLVPQLQASIEESAGNMEAARRILEKAVADSPDNLELRDALCRHLLIFLLKLCHDFGYICVRVGVDRLTPNRRCCAALQNQRRRSVCRA